MDFDQVGANKIGRRWIFALTLFLFALIGLLAGVSLTERPDVLESSWLTKAYYSLGLFVFGGLDVGMPSGGPLWGRMLLWLAYFGAPMLTASAVIEAALRVMSPHRWQMKRLRDHIVIVGSDELTISYLRVLRAHSPTITAVVVDMAVETVRQQELERTFDVSVIVGDITHDFVIESLGLDRARKIVLLGNDSFHGYEAASKIISRHPGIGARIVLHSHRLRFMRSMQDTYVAQQCISFNSYHLASTGLVRDHLIDHFEKTAARDVVVIAGFGRFGQTVLEELVHLASDEVETVALIDVDAGRRVQVVDEQERLGDIWRREVFEGDISHPEVWQRLTSSIDLSVGEPVVILGTGRTGENLRTALWVKKKYPRSVVFTRCNQISEFAQQVGSEHDIHAISLTELVEENIPIEWVR